MPAGREDVLYAEAQRVYRERCMRRRRFGFVYALCMMLATAGGLSAGCKSQDEAAKENTNASSGLLISIPPTGNPDIAQFLFTYTRVECYAGEPFIPMSYEAFAAPLNAGPDNPAADHFEPLEAGCYDVMVFALDSNGQQVPECSVDSFNTQVHDNKTTEVTSFIQCSGGPGTGGINTTVFVNQPPWFSGGTYDPDKWVASCDLQTICVSFTDPNKSDIEFVWTQVGGIPLATPPTVAPDSHTKDENGTSTECVMLKHAGPGKVELLVTAYDLMPNPDGPGDIRVEDYLQGKGLNYTSHDTMQMFSFGMATDACPCEPNAEVCDDIDNNCDGKADEGLSCACIIGEKTPCYTGAPSTLGVGNCMAGYKECLPNGSGFEAACHDEVKPSAEKADGQDNDCNNSIDDNAPCVSGAPCYFGPKGTDGVGICTAGTQVCKADGTFQSCMGQTLPQPEIPNNNIDENCNNKIDDSGNIGAEVCNGIDDNGNGQIDEGLGSKTCGVGACKVTVQACLNGQAQVCTPGMPTAEIPNNGIDENCDNIIDNVGTEVCNGADDNSNGQIDEGLGNLQCGTGACQNTVPACVNGQSQMCVPGQPAPNETCGDGIDNNCNGSTDENCPACAPTEICGDGIDNDCNGFIDDGCVCSPPTAEICDPNGVDEDHDGLINDDDNNLTYNGFPIFCCPTGAEVADGIDNDCNGMIDEYVSCFPTQPQNQELANGIDDNCNGLIDEGAGCTYSAEICDSADQDCDLVPDNGLNCGYEVCGINHPGANPGVLKDPRVGYVVSTHFGLINYLNANDYPGIRYNSLPMAVGSGKWYWESPVSWNYVSPCIGVGTSDTPLTANSSLSDITDGYCLKIDTDPNGGYAGYLYPGGTKILSWANKDIKGAVVSVLVDMTCGTITFWVNGDAATGASVPVPLTANKTYYPMAWMQDNVYSYYGYHYCSTYDVTSLNFGPTFFETKPAAYQQHL